MNRFSEEMRIIPKIFWALATIACLGLPALIFGYAIVNSRQHMLGMRTDELLIFVPIFAIFALYLLLVGYICGDAKRRGMRPVLWTLLAFFIPNMIGIILYFILRNPLLRDCPQCGKSSASNFAFCPSCGTAISNACPSCRSAVEPGWSHCAKCGSTLKTSQTT
jgi:hypothetical protein